MKIFVLQKQPVGPLMNILRQHFISERSSYFFNKLSQDVNGHSFEFPKELQSQLYLQIMKIMMHQLYRYVEENKMSDYIHHITHNLFGQALYVYPLYATELLKPYYENNYDPIHHQEIENDITQTFYNHINTIYSSDSQRFNMAFNNIISMFVDLIPSNSHVIRFELTPHLAPMVCCSEPSGMMQSLYA